MKSELVRKVILTFIHPDSRDQIQKIFTKFDNDPIQSLLSGMKHIQIFTTNKNQMVAGAAITGMVLGALLAEAEFKPELEKLLEEFSNFEKDDKKVVPIGRGRKKNDFDA